MQSDTSQTTGSHYIFLNNFGHQSVGIQSFVCNRGTQFCVTAGSTLIYISANEGVRHSVLSALSVYLKIFPYRKKYIHKYLCKAFMVHTMTFLSLFCLLPLRNKQVGPNIHSTKGQLISKCLFCVFNSSKKPNENNST